MLKAKYEDIVDVAAIGLPANPNKLTDLAVLARSENLTPASADAEQVCLIAIDVQQDFMEGGTLGVPGANQDVERLTRWIYENMGKLSCISTSLDTHDVYQIFHPAWWVNKDGQHPNPYTIITQNDVDHQVWRPVFKPAESRDYVSGLVKSGRQVLCIWPYHCLQGTAGHALDNQFANMVYFHSLARQSRIQYIIKGSNPVTEMYGIIKPEYDPQNFVNTDFLNKIVQFDKLVIAGEAKSHCVLESIRQILEHFTGQGKATSQIYVLEDCMSMIPGFEENCSRAFEEFKTKYKVNMVRSTEFRL